MIVTDALSSRALTRPPDSGPGATVEAWRAFAAQETGRSIEGDLDKVKDRQALIALVNQAGQIEEPKVAPDGVKVAPEPKAKDALGRPEWMVPVEGGYASETAMVTAEREARIAEQKRRHEEAQEQLKGKR